MSRMKNAMQKTRDALVQTRDPQPMTIHPSLCSGPTLAPAIAKKPRRDAQMTSPPKSKSPALPLLLIVTRRVVAQ